MIAPEDSIRSEVPGDLDWGAYLDLKLTWGLSMAALVHRVHDLGVTDDAPCTRAMKQPSAYGWRRVTCRVGSYNRDGLPKKDPWRGDLEIRRSPPVAAVNGRGP